MKEQAYQTLKRPLITEKSTAGKEQFNNLYFEVDRWANKIQIKHAVEQIFRVNVLQVRTAMVKGKLKRVGRHTSKTPDWKKAVVTIKPGQRVEFFEGV